MRNPGQPIIHFQKNAQVSGTVGADQRTRDRRKSRIIAIVGDGFPCPPKHVFELIRLLSLPVVDLKKVSIIIGKDGDLAAQILRLAHTVSGNRRSSLEISEAVVLLGSEHLRMLILSCAVMKFAGSQLPALAIQKFWHHSFLTAAFSEEIARRMQYHAVDQSNLAGLLHDIGRLPLLIAAQEEPEDTSLLEDWQDNLALERTHFGVDHTEVGRWIGISWNFSASLIDVLEHHHDPSKALEDQRLTEIVAAGDKHCIRQHKLAAEDASVFYGPELDPTLLLGMRPSSLCSADRTIRSRFLEDEDSGIPFPQFGLS
jgi:putative nucleotidyltransferase with HDIG domain